MRTYHVYRNGRASGASLTPSARPLWSGAPLYPETPGTISQAYEPGKVEPIGMAEPEDEVAGQERLKYNRGE